MGTRFTPVLSTSPVRADGSVLDMVPRLVDIVRDVVAVLLLAHAAGGSAGLSSVSMLNYSSITGQDIRTGLLRLRDY